VLLQFYYQKNPHQTKQNKKLVNPATPCSTAIVTDTTQYHYDFGSNCFTNK